MSILESQPVFAALSQALDVAALRQAVHTANIANAGVPGYRRLEVIVDSQVQASSSEPPDWDTGASPAGARVVQTAADTVKLDKEMALMAKDATRYQALLSAFERTASLLQLAIREGKEG